MPPKLSLHRDAHQSLPTTGSDRRILAAHWTCDDPDLVPPGTHGDDDDEPCELFLGPDAAAERAAARAAQRERRARARRRAA